MPSHTHRPGAASPWPGHRARLARLLLTVAGVALVLTACTTGRATGVDAPPVVPSTASEAPSVGAPGAAQDIAPERWAAARQRSVDALLRSRLAAAEGGDLRGWLAPLDDDAALRRSEAAVLTRMAAIGVGDLQPVAERETTPPVPAPAGTAVQWDVRVSLRYRIRGFDTAARAFDLDLTFRADPDRPQRLTITASTPSGRPQPWDLGGLKVRRSPTGLVLAVGDDSHVEEIARRARTAAARVAAVWGSARRAVWVAPATDADAARLLGRSAGAHGLGGVSAATDGPLSAGEPAGADRIVLVPGTWASLQPDGRDVVMTHELTHVTVRGSTTRAIPAWLSEGFAEFVAYRPIRLPEKAVVGPAVALVRATGPPASLPADGDFTPGTPTLQAAYGLSMLAVRTLADAHGTEAVVRLYRAAAGGLDVATDRLDDSEGIVDDALRGTVGTTRARLVRDWQARLRGLLR